MQSLEVFSAVGTHIGRVRENNEDNFYYNGIYLNESNREIPAIFSEKRESEIQIYAVCDGMGGEESGEVASLIAVHTLTKYQEMLNNIKYHSFDKYIEMYLSEVNNLICEKSKQIGGKRIGTTIAMLCIEGNIVHIYSIGDSRVYLMRNKRMKQITEDHTQAMRSVKMGIITMEEAKTHPHRHKLTQYLGIAPEEMIFKPYCFKKKAKNGDLFLLCSDGVSDMLEDYEIEHILKQKKSEKAIVSDLIGSALKKGGRDNITAMVIRICRKKSLFGFKR
ncbi:MAG TPA: serine/threonine-protein phosphatase [Clostridiaceae bacterium]|nr:serine/threonine-protein phosphatase [Clostridiaceae bacterium]